MGCVTELTTRAVAKGSCDWLERARTLELRFSINVRRIYADIMARPVPVFNCCICIRRLTGFMIYGRAPITWKVNFVLFHSFAVETSTTQNVKLLWCGLGIEEERSICRWKRGCNFFIFRLFLGESPWKLKKLENFNNSFNSFGFDHCDICSNIERRIQVSLVFLEFQFLTPNHLIFN